MGKNQTVFKQLTYLPEVKGIIRSTLTHFFAFRMSISHTAEELKVSEHPLSPSSSQPPLQPGALQRILTNKRPLNKSQPY
ncbi:hypothetical protein HHUSO_G16387 [Huso huso]|uniref:Uncharacterized protein n=1 Tax=Huso huso TaxID=61971 RepID=A0ABR0ZAU1_HUSHU